NPLLQGRLRAAFLLLGPWRPGHPLAGAGRRVYPRPFDLEPEGGLRDRVFPSPSSARSRPRPAGELAGLTTDGPGFPFPFLWSALRGVRIPVSRPAARRSAKTGFVAAARSGEDRR